MKYEGINPLDKLRPREPYFFVRAQDKFAICAIRGYETGLIDAARVAEGRAELSEDDRESLLAYAAHLRRQVRDIEALRDFVIAWQQNHPDLVKTPD